MNWTDKITLCLWAPLALFAFWDNTLPREAGGHFPWQTILNNQGTLIVCWFLPIWVFFRFLDATYKYGPGSEDRY